jgi:ABC-2 type transport system permease protein
MFNAQLEFQWILFIIVVLTSTIAMMGYGILLLLIFKKPESAETAASILMTFMMFISGIFSPENMLPEAMKIVAYFFPLKYTGILIRYTTGMADISAGTFILINVVFVVAGMGLVALTSKKFLSTT